MYIYIYIILYYIILYYIILYYIILYYIILYYIILYIYMYRFYIDMPNISALKTGRDPESLEPGTLPCGQDGHYGESSQTQISGCFFYILLVHFTSMKHFRSIPSWLLVGDLVKPPISGCA